MLSENYVLKTNTYDKIIYPDQASTSTQVFSRPQVKIKKGMFDNTSTYN